MRQFFEGDNGRLSMTRLLCFLSFFPASYVVARTAESETLSWYLAAYAVSYLGGKTADAFSKWCNAAGGINGRKIVVDKWDATLRAVASLLDPTERIVTGPLVGSAEVVNVDKP